MDDLKPSEDSTSRGRDCSVCSGAAEMEQVELEKGLLDLLIWKSLVELMKTGCRGGDESLTGVDLREK